MHISGLSATLLLSVLKRRFLCSHSSHSSVFSDVSFIVLLCSSLSSTRMWQTLSLHSAHINNKITSCSLLLWLAIILQFKSCRELEAKWMLWRMLMCVEWEHCLPLAIRVTAFCFECFFKEAFSCCHKQSNSLHITFVYGRRETDCFAVTSLAYFGGWVVTEAAFCAPWCTKWTWMYIVQTFPDLSNGLH